MIDSKCAAGSTAIGSDQVIKKCYEILGMDIPQEQAMDTLLSLAGEFYDADRAYIFEYSDNKEVVMNTFEWCKDGVEPMISLLQDVPSKEVDGWVEQFKLEGAFHMSSRDSERNTSAAADLLEMQGIESLVAAPIINAGQIVGFIGVDNPASAGSNVEVLKIIAAVSYNEILKRKQVELAMLQSAKIFSDAFLKSYSSAYYVCLSDKAYVIVTHSGNIKKWVLKHKTYTEFLDLYVDLYVHPEDKDALREAIQPDYIRKRLAGEKGFSLNYRDFRLEKLRWFRYDVTRGSDEDHVGIAFSEVTELLEKEEHEKALMEEALSMARAASRAKTVFLNNMSHDIRTPMNAIIGYTNLAASHLDDMALVKEYLDKISLSSGHLLSLINDVLDMSRIESGKIHIEETQESIIEIVRSLGTIVQADIKAKGHAISMEFKDVHDEFVYCDKLRFNQVMLNILSNAIKYTPSGGSIYISVTEKEIGQDGFAGYEFRVRDNGIGMDPEFLKVVYEPFVRMKSSTISGIQGTGLGMSITKGLVDMMGGKINVSSEVGKGTEVTVSFDFRLAEAGSELSLQEDSDDKDIQGVKILLVEDNALNMEIALTILEGWGCKVTTAEDGDIAVRIMKEAAPGEFDMVFMDVQMPTVNGYDATRQIRALGTELSEIPIIAMTANAFDEDRRLAMEAGMNGHVAKPIDVIQLKNIIAKYFHE